MGSDSARGCFCFSTREGETCATERPLHAAARSPSDLTIEPSDSERPPPTNRDGRAGGTHGTPGGPTRRGVPANPSDQGNGSGAFRRGRPGGFAGALIAVKRQPPRRDGPAGMLDAVRFCARLTRGSTGHKRPEKHGKRWRASWSPGTLVSRQRTHGGRGRAQHTPLDGRNV